MTKISNTSIKILLMYLLKLINELKMQKMQLNI